MTMTPLTSTEVSVFFTVSQPRWRPLFDSIEKSILVRFVHVMKQEDVHGQV